MSSEDSSVAMTAAATCSARGSTIALQSLRGEGHRVSLTGLALLKSDWQKVSMGKAHQAVVELAGREVVITNPDKPFRKPATPSFTW